MSEIISTKLDKSNYNKEILELISKYSIDKKPIDVSFRTLVPELNKPDRLTHLIHSYPAKLLMHIPYFFLNNDIFSKKNDLIFDPFSGSGTVLLESILAGRNAIGSDANPLARLISKVKVHNYDPEQLAKYAKVLFSRLDSNNIAVLPNGINLNYWFLPKIQSQLAIIFEGINKIRILSIRDFFLVCFSNCIKKVSLADQRVSVPVKLNPDRYDFSHPLHIQSKKKLENLKNMDVFEKFSEIVLSNIDRFKLLKPHLNDSNEANVISEDARFITKRLRSKAKFDDESVNLIITSPPYAGAQKYIRASSLNLGWLDVLRDSKTLKNLENISIGRENYLKKEYSKFCPTGVAEADLLLKKIFKINPLRAFIAGNYLREMEKALGEAVRLLKPDGHFVLVVGNNQVCGFEFQTQEYLKQILEKLGLAIVLKLIDDIQSYGLMTKRNKTASIITREWVLVFKK